MPDAEASRERRTLLGFGVGNNVLPLTKVLALASRNHHGGPSPRHVRDRLRPNLPRRAGSWRSLKAVVDLRLPKQTGPPQTRCGS